MSTADTKPEAEAPAAPEIRTARLTVDMTYDAQSDESERAGKLIATMMNAFHQAITAMELDGCAASSALADVLLQNMARNGHKGCACRTAMSYLQNAGADVEVSGPGAATPAQRKAMH